MTIADQLLLLNSTKTAIATAIEDKGVTVGAIPFSQYPAKIAEISGGGGDGDWNRPADWLPLPEVLPTEQKFVGLYAVNDDDRNYVAISLSGAYTVDWGDGIVENFSGGAIAQHQYDYASLPVGSLSSRGYKQAIVSIVPQDGSDIVNFNMAMRPTAFGNQVRTTGWLDASISAPVLAGSSFVVVGQTAVVSHLLLERFNVVSTGAITSLNQMFNGCQSLQSVPLFDTSSVTNMQLVFGGCSMLKTIPPFNTQSVTSFSQTFSGCTSLLSIPILDLSSTTSLSSTFQNCSSLKELPLLNMVGITILNQTFSGCRSLLTIPLFDTATVTTWNGAFQACSALRTVPALNMSGATATGNNMFYNCFALARSDVTGVSVSIAYSNCNLSATVLNEVFTNLATVTGQTITITNNPGAATCDRTIATAKGWTVTG